VELRHDEYKMYVVYYSFNEKAVHFNLIYNSLLSILLAAITGIANPIPVTSGISQKCS
jgi:hypothetical protein